MPIISRTDQQTWKGRIAVSGIYFLLTLGGLTMVLPFLIMITGSVSTPFDYDRRSVLPRYLWSREDRFLRMLASYFPPSHRGSTRQLRMYFPDLPQDWQTWPQIGDDTPRSDKWADKQLARIDDPAQRKYVETAAADYADWMKTWNLRETVLAYDQRDVTPFLRGQYGSLAKFNAAWETSADDFTKVSASEWGGEPVDQPGYIPLVDTRYTDLLRFRDAYRQGVFSRGLGTPDAPASYLRPAALRFLWEDYAVKQGLATQEDATKLPFPVPADADKAMLEGWRTFLENGFPMRHVSIDVTPALQARFRSFLVERFGRISYLNEVTEGTFKSWDDVALTPVVPEGPLAKIWMDFLRTAVPVQSWHLRDTLPEVSFQKYALARHGDLAGINAAYGMNLDRIEQLVIPFDRAVLTTFANRGGAITWDQSISSYRFVADYLLTRGNAIPNTILLVGMAILITLTVNPLAGYALSRFRLRQGEKIVVFCLATMAFPAAVSAIPGFLLLRDLGLLNTFAALVLPGAANGMAIFLLKGFFDSLPQELYEAATIDGAPEWLIFWEISLPLVKPILAVNMLNAFIHSYNGWEWALIVCQDPRMWTVSVWTYQFYQTFGGNPATIMAAFIVTSIPVLAVFLLCQKIILRGIILPQMK